MYMGKNHSIAVLAFVGIGDMVQFSPCFRLLKERFPNSYLTLITPWGSVRGLFERSRYIDEIIYFDLFAATALEKISFIRMLREKCFDLSILPYPSYRREFNVFSWLVGAKQRYAFKFSKGMFSEFAFLNNHLVNVDESARNVKNNLKLVMEVGCKTNLDEDYELPITGLDSFKNYFFDKNDIKPSDLVIGIHPGSDKRGKERRLDASKFVALSDILYEKYHAKLVIFLGPHEADLHEVFLKSTKGHQHILVTGFQIDEVAKIISFCHLFISSDSGLMHIASAMKVPTVAIFGPTDPMLVGPWKVPYEIVRLKLECSPCFFFTEKHPLDKPLIECKIDDKFACMRGIEIKEILQKVDKLLVLIRKHDMKNP